MKKTTRVKKAKNKITFTAKDAVNIRASLPISAWDVDRGFHELIEKVEKVYAHQEKVNDLMAESVQVDPNEEAIRLFHECQNQMIAIIKKHEELLQQFKAFRQ